MVAIQDTETHLRRRKNWNRGMSPAAIREYEPFIAKRARQLVEGLEEQKGAVTIGNWFNYFSCVHVRRAWFDCGWRDAKPDARRWMLTGTTS